MIIADVVISAPVVMAGSFRAVFGFLKLGTEAGPTDVFWSRNSGQVTERSVDVDE